MSNRPRFAELFAGAGGLSLGLERAGWDCAWHAEISDAPRAILSHRWPSVPLLGDVTTLDGGALVALHGPIDLLSGGSPCQDLSVAGKRAGMTEGSGTRSSLFFEQMRLWKETGADLCLWENVDGARSSNTGKDFGEVLRAFVGAAVPVPSDGWRGAGVAAGPRGVAAWRVLDAQFFGVPQRRRRIFVLGTRTGRVDPAEVLSLAESLRGDTPQSEEAGEGSADSVDASPDESRGLIFDTLNNKADDIAHTLRSNMDRGSGWGGVLSFDWQKGNDKNNPRPSTLNVRHERTDPLRANTVPAVIAFGQQNSARQGASASASAKCTPSLDRSKVPGVVCVTGEVTHGLTHDGSDGSEDGTGRGTPIVLAVDFAQITNKDNRSQPQPQPQPLSPTLNAKGDVHVFNETGHEKWTDETVAGSLNAHEAHTIVADQEIASTSEAGIPRRLTPRECERLMHWPDDHTLVPDAKGKLLSDSARYKACGNGVASVHSQWIGWRLRLALEAA